MSTSSSPATAPTLMSAQSPLRRRSSLGGPSTRTGILPPSLGTSGSTGSSSSSLLATATGPVHTLSTTSSASAAGGPGTLGTLAGPLPTHVLPASHAPAALSPMVLPDAFAQVEPGIFRSSMPSAAHIPFLRTLALRSIVLLTPEAPSRAVAAWLDEAGVQVVHLGAARVSSAAAAATPRTAGAYATTNPTATAAAAAAAGSGPAGTNGGGMPGTSTAAGPTWRPVPEDLIKEALQHILTPASHPVLIACTTGIHETGTVVGCLRRMQRWNFNAIAFEYRSFADTKARYAAEQMIELWDVDWVVVPQGAADKVVGLVCPEHE